jgi:hypothetical protein
MKERPFRGPQRASPKRLSDPSDHLYVAIGSMMNPTSMKLRGLSPLQSWPVRCVGVARRFWGKFGMAEIFFDEGADFHGVLHKMSDADMSALDRMERGYFRRDVDCYLYDGTHMVGTAYQFDRSKLMVDAARPPSQRYVDLMVEGMAHFGCDSDAIARLKATPNPTPRRKPEAYQRILVPQDGRMFTWAEVVDSDGLEGRPLRVVFSGHVMEFVEPEGAAADAIAARRQRELENAGRDVTHRIVGNFDPLFLPASGVEEMSDAHRAFAEDKYWRYVNAPPVFYRCIGRVSDYHGAPRP